MNTQPKPTTTVTQPQPKKNWSAVGIIIIIAFVICAISYTWWQFAPKTAKVIAEAPIQTIEQKIANLTQSNATEQPQVSEQTQLMPQQPNNNAEITALISQLDSIMQQIETLPVPPQQKTINAVVEPQTQNISIPLWRRFVNSLGATLKEIVSIRRQTVEPLPLPEQMLTLRLNIQTKLLQAEMAVLQQNQQLYLDALNQVSHWIAKYFVIDTQNSQQLLHTLSELQKVDLPTIKSQLNQTNESLPKPAQEKTKAPDTIERVKLL